MDKDTAANLIQRLPSEIRLHIYSYVVPKIPLMIPPREFSGLLYSCKAIQAELEPEICKSMARFIGAIAAKIRICGDEMTYTPPTSLQGWLNLTISRPKTKNMFISGDPFLWFKYLYFDVLIVTFHNDEKGYEYYQGTPRTYQQAARSLANELSRYSSREDFPAMRRWILDWRAYPQYSNSTRIETSLYAGGIHAWEVDQWIDDAGVITGVCFFRVWSYDSFTSRRVLLDGNASNGSQEISNKTGLQLLINEFM